MRKSKYIIPIVVVLLLLCGAAYWLYAGRNQVVVRDFEAIEKSGTLRVVVDYNALAYHVSGDTLSGFNSELLGLLQQQTPIRFDVAAESRIEEQMRGLKSGKYDLVASNITVTSEYRDSLGFTEPITRNKLVLVQRKKEYNFFREPIRSHLDLAKKTLHIPQKSPVTLRIRNLSHEIGDTIYYVEDPLYNSEQLAMKVASGEIEFAVCDEQNVKKIAADLPEIDYGTYIGFTHIEAWAVRADSPVLLDSLNGWLEKVKATKEYDLLLKKYYRSK